MQSWWRGGEEPAASSGFLAVPPGLSFWVRAEGKDGSGDRNLGLGLEVAACFRPVLPSRVQQTVAECGGRAGMRMNARTLSVQGPHWRLLSAPGPYFRSFFSEEGKRRTHVKTKSVMF